MNAMKMTPFLLILTFLMGMPAIAAPQSDASNTAAVAQPKPEISRTMGFQEWKKNQVFDAKMNLDKFKSPQLSKTEVQPVQPEEKDPNVDNSGDNTDNPTENAAEVAQTTNEDAEKLRQLEFNLEIAQGLTIHDYFALYLKNKSKVEMAEAIQQLSPDELSELLMAYRKALYGVPVQEANTETAVNKNL